MHTFAILPYTKVVLASGLSNVCYFFLAFLFYISLGQFIGRKFIHKIESAKQTHILILEIIMNTWLAGILAAFAHWIYNLTPIDSILNIEAHFARDAGIGGLFMTYFVAFDSKMKGQLNILSERIQKIDLMSIGKSMGSIIQKTTNKMGSFGSNRIKTVYHEKNEKILY